MMSIFVYFSADLLILIRKPRLKLLKVTSYHRDFDLKWSKVTNSIVLGSNLVRHLHFCVFWGLAMLVVHKAEKRLYLGLLAWEK